MAIKDRLYGVPLLGTTLRVQDRYKEDAGDQFAGAIGFFGFLSIFPLLLLALSVVGFVLADMPADQVREVEQQIATNIQNAIPGFTAALSGGEGSSTAVGDALDTIVDNRQAGGIVGLVLLLLSGLRVVNSAQTATLKIFRIDLTHLSPVKQKAQQVVALGALGLVALAGVAAGSAIGVVTELEFLGVMEVVGPVVATGVTFVLDVALFLAAYRLFGTSDGPPVRTLLPGAILGGFGWTVLKLVGATYVADQVSKAGQLYGALGGVIGLMLLLYLAGRLFVYGAELSAVRAPDPQHPADALEEVGSETRAADDDVAAAAGAAGVVGAPLYDDRHVAATAPSSDPRSSPGGAALLAPTASDRTRARLAAMPDPEHHEGQGRHALAFAVAIGAVAGLAGVLRPWDRD